ncbi:glycosyltransferase [Haloarcula onubensis]|uniref:Glycosyltransferase family 2 protein n=1 Tax=Haloarcula onubensis TaxID=2950539 RepID=A0ABU2FPE2_9EURY|nr:glycosyltransferase [Halomicroarcula sp. S3CR25-11]MDS0282630.1 glycosyltransferase family 2 protein [Halomicroarcula sp. S3CR25-11]
MSTHPPTSVLLPTVSPTAVVGELTEQLSPSDELLVVCDSETDAIADAVADRPENVRLVVAGEPDGCSGKANAVAAGMEAASNDRLVWTDDDFHHPADWLDRLNGDYDRHGPTTELPFFVGRDPLAVLLEPLYAVAGTVGTYAGDIAWGGAVVFERDDLPDWDAFLCDLGRTVSDDGLLTDRVDITPVWRTRRVEMGGTIRESLERHVRFTKLGRHHDPAGSTTNAVLGTLATIGGLAFPLPVAAVLTLALACVYTAAGRRRWTFLLAYPAVMISMPLMLYGLARRTFVWGGRRYRWREPFDVESEGV